MKQSYLKHFFITGKCLSISVLCGSTCFIRNTFCAEQRCSSVGRLECSKRVWKHWNKSYNPTLRCEVCLLLKSNSNLTHVVQTYALCNNLTFLDSFHDRRTFNSHKLFYVISINYFFHPNLPNNYIQKIIWNKSHTCKACGYCLK